MYDGIPFTTTTYRSELVKSDRVLELVNPVVAFASAADQRVNIPMSLIGRVRNVSSVIGNVLECVMVIGATGPSVVDVRVDPAQLVEARHVLGRIKIPRRAQPPVGVASERIRIIVRDGLLVSPAALLDDVRLSRGVAEPVGRPIETPVRKTR